MALTVQNLRAVGTGVEPASLLPGQICFNITDKVLYVGDGSSFKTSFDGTQVAGVPGEGWYAMPMDFASLGDYYVANPLYYGDVPTDQQVLTWSTALNHPIWTSGGGGGGGNQVYVATNAQVASASGATTSDKITAAIGVASPDEGDVTIVTGLPDDVYEGLYFFTTEWVKGAAYAYPSASEVIYDNTVTGLTPTVQGAIDDLDAGLTATTAIANTANSTANSALSIANAALPKAGGTMTGTIVARSIDIQSGYNLQFLGTGYIAFNAGANGTITGITDAVSSTSSTLAGSANAVRFAYDLANAALPKAGGTMTGAITFASGQIFPVSGIQDASASQKGVVQVGSNIQVAAGTISILDSTTSNKGVVQLNDTLTSTSILQALTARAGKDLQDQIDSLTLASNVTLAGSLNASSGLIDSVTTQGAALVPPLVAGASLINAVPANADYYVLVTTAGSYSPPGGGGPYLTEPGDWFLSNGTTWQYLGVGARPQSATYTTAGIVQLADTAVTYTGTSDTEAVTPNSLQDKVTDSVSTTDSNLIASATAVKTAYDIGAAAIPCSTITAVGDIVVGGAGSAPTALPVGTDGQVLVANSACSSGLEWVSDTPGDVTSVTATSPVTADNTDPQNPIIGIDAASTTQAGAVQLNDTVTSTATTEAATANAAKTAYDKGVAACTIAQAAIPCASFTGLGELLTGAGAGTFSALPVGADGQVLLADSLAPEGLAWGNACYVPDSCFTAAGEIIVGTGAGAYVALPVGVDGQTLVADSTCTEGVKWGAAIEGFTQGSTLFNTAIGVNAGCSLTTGYQNVLLGAGAGDCLTTGYRNIAIGYNALGGSLAGSIRETIAIGYEAGGCLYGGSQNVIIGDCSGYKITSGFCNVILGDCAACALTTGASNTIIGAGAASSATAFTSNANTGVGSRALHKITSGDTNTSVGGDSAFFLTTGACNAMLGAGAGYSLTTGCRNSFVGLFSGCGITTGGCNTIVGAYCTTASGLSNNVVLADGVGTVKFQANANGAWSPDGTNYGTIGQVLTSNGTVAAPTWNTLSLACVPCAAYTAVGDILVGTGAATYSALPLGTSGQVMVVDTACASGVKWVTATGLNLAGFTCSATPFNTALGSLAGAALTALSVANTAIGYGALDAETSGDFNVAVGHNALTAQNGASGNVAIGGNAGAQVTSGSNNTLIGCNTGDALTTGAANVAIGNGALGAGVSSSTSVAIGFNALAVTTASNNVAVGTSAGTNTTSGTFNAYFGGASGQANTTGSNNVYLGYAAGCSATTGVSNTLVGSCAGRGIVGQDNNVAVGFETLMGTLAVGNGGHVAIGTCALRAVTTGLNNLAIGCNAGLLITTGGCNIAIGAGALDSVTTTANNIGIGFNALTTITSGSENLAIGTRSGCAVTTGAFNTFVGYQAGCAVTTGNQNTMVGPYVGTAGLSNNVVLSDGASNIRFQANSSGAWSPDGTNYGTSGQILSSGGTGAAAAWTSSLPEVTAPTASTDPGTQGQIASDSTYFYMYTGGRWQRVAWDTTGW